MLGDLEFHFWKRRIFSQESLHHPQFDLLGFLLICGSFDAVEASVHPSVKWVTALAWK